MDVSIQNLGMGTRNLLYCLLGDWPGFINHTPSNLLHFLLFYLISDWMLTSTSTNHYRICEAVANVALVDFRTSQCLFIRGLFSMLQDAELQLQPGVLIKRIQIRMRSAIEDTDRSAREASPSLPTNTLHARRK